MHSSLLNTAQPASYLFRNARLLDPRFDEPREGYEVLVEGGEFKEVYGDAVPTHPLRLLDLPYFRGARGDDPDVLPGVSREVLEKFPPTLLITAPAISS